MPQPYLAGVTRRQPSRLHAAIAERDPGWACSYCAAALAHGDVGYRASAYGSEGSVAFLLEQGYSAAHADHLVARAQGGLDRLDNRVLACERCNTAKRADSLLVFLARRAAA